MRRSSRAFVLAMMISILPVSATYAAEYKEINGVPLEQLTEEQEEYGHSTFSVIVGQQNADTVSFEVPLYVTMAAIGGQEELLVPTNYSITNTSGKYIDDDTEDVDSYSIIVAGISFTKLESATYSTVETKGTEYYELMFSLGGITMPPISRDEAEITVDVNMTTQGSVFYSGSQYTIIPAIGDTELPIPLVATLSDVPNFESNKAATAQYKICYTVSPVNAGGDVLGFVYAGDNKADAGLE